MTQQTPTGRGTAPAIPSVATVLEVAAGLRWQDPNLSAALAEHAVRLAGDDAELRGAAERAAIRALGELDQPGVVVARAVPQLEAAVTERRPDDAAALRCLLVGAALQCGDATAARGLLDAALAEVSLRSTPELRGEVELRAAQVLAVEADVSGTDAAARRAAAAVSWAAGAPGSSASALDLVRARAAARRASGDVAGAVALLDAAAPTGVVQAEPDGGRRALLVIVDLVSALLDLGDTAGARARAAGFLTGTPGPTTALPLGQLQCTIARRVHLPARELDAADAVARTAEADLSARGHDAVAADACEIVATAAEARGDLAAALAAVRRAHALEMRAVEEQHRVRRALTTVLVTAAVSPPKRERVPGAGPETGRNGAHASVPIAGGRRTTPPILSSPDAAGASGATRVPDEERPARPAAGPGGDASGTSGVGGTSPGAADGGTPAGPAGGGSAPPSDGAAPEEDPEVLAALEAAVVAAGIRRGGRRRRSETVDDTLRAADAGSDTDAGDPGDSGRPSLFEAVATVPGPDALGASGGDLDGDPKTSGPATVDAPPAGDGSFAAEQRDDRRSTDDHADGAGRIHRDRPGSPGDQGAGRVTPRYREDAGDPAVDREGDHRGPGDARPDDGERVDDERGSGPVTTWRAPSPTDEPWWRSTAGRGGEGSSPADPHHQWPALELPTVVDGEDPLFAPVSWGPTTDRDDQEQSAPDADGGRSSSPLDGSDRRHGAEPAGDERRPELGDEGTAGRGATVERDPGTRRVGHRGDERDPLAPALVARRDDAAGLDGSVDAADHERARGAGGLRTPSSTAGGTGASRGGRRTGPAPEAGRNGRARSVQRAGEEEPARDRRPDPADEEAEDLALTLAGLLAEYDVPNGSGPAPSAAHPAPSRARGDGSDGRGRGAPGARRTNGRPDDRADARSRGAVPAARPVPGLASGTAHDDGAGAGPAPRARGAGPDPGARLADLLAEAMDAFRRTGPGADEHVDRPATPRG